MSKNEEPSTTGTMQTPENVRIVCTECTFSKLVTKEGQKSAEVIVEHGRETGHRLTAKEPDDVE